MVILGPILSGPQQKATWQYTQVTFYSTENPGFNTEITWIKLNTAFLVHSLLNIGCFEIRLLAQVNLL